MLRLVGCFSVPSSPMMSFKTPMLLDGSELSFFIEVPRKTTR